MDPADIRDGLALYRRGSGRPLLLVPYPHGATHGPMVASPLAGIAEEIGYQVLTFDPPGFGRSARSALVTLDEMLDCIEEALAAFGHDDQMPVLGHSMSALCAFFFALRRPERVSHLALVGTPPGSGVSTIRYRGMPFNWPPWHPNLWKGIVWGSMLAAGRGSMAMHKKMVHLRARASYVNQDLVPELLIEPDDHGRPAPPRNEWWYAIRKVRTIPRAEQLRPPTLLLVGRHDPQTPVGISRALHERIPRSQLMIFEQSGHSPFVEEADLFRRTLGEFLASRRRFPVP